MKLQHYLGGLEGLDPINYEKKVFVQPWETRIFGIHVAMMGLSRHLEYVIDAPTKFNSVWTWADLRKGAEAMNPFDYFKYRYYEKWLGGISGFFIEEGYITEKELNERTEAYLRNAVVPSAQVSEAKAIDEQIIEYLRTGDPSIREIDRKPMFSVGETVKIKNNPVTDHTRLPGYLREKVGVIDLVYAGNHIYFCSTGPDGLGGLQEAMPVYRVRFEPEKIWGEMSEANSAIYADIYEVYLDKN
jgi:nitrile hydratase